MSRNLGGIGDTTTLPLAIVHGRRAARHPDRLSAFHVPSLRRIRQFVAGSLSTALPVTLPVALLTGCLMGPSSALSGGPIGRAPDLREAALLPEPDSTRGTGFTIIANRRDILEESRVELNAAARAYERLLGARPADGAIRLTSDDRQVHVVIRGARPQPTAFVASLGREARGRPLLPEAMRIANDVVLAMSHEWLSSAVHDLVPGDTSSAGWMARASVPAWLRAGLLLGVAENATRERWLVQLARQRDSLPSVAEMLRSEGCDACLASFARLARQGGAVDNAADPLTEDVFPAARRGRAEAMDARERLLASTYSLVLFMSRREGPEFMRALVAAAVAGGDVSAALGTARSFTADPGDIDRQWRVWLASFANSGRQ